jgi:hypothetical protein
MVRRSLRWHTLTEAGTARARARAPGPGQLQSLLNGAQAPARAVPLGDSDLGWRLAGSSHFGTLRISPLPLTRSSLRLQVTVGTVVTVPSAPQQCGPAWTRLGL